VPAPLSSQGQALAKARSATSAVVLLTDRPECLARACAVARSHGTGPSRGAERSKRSLRLAGLCLWKPSDDPQRTAGFREIRRPPSRSVFRRSFCAVRHCSGRWRCITIPRRGSGLSQGRRPRRSASSWVLSARRIEQPLDDHAVPPEAIQFGCRGDRSSRTGPHGSGRCRPPCRRPFGWQCRWPGRAPELTSGG
jgi:hypothetical protein